MDNDVILNEYSKTQQGLKDLLRVVRRYSDSFAPKLRDMETEFLKANPDLYDDNEKAQLNYFREAFSYKFCLATMHLEQIWAITHIEKINYPLKLVLENIFDFHRTTENHVLLLSFAFEGFIVQGNAFLDFYLLYLCRICKIKGTNHLSGSKFIKALDHIEEKQFADRAKAIKRYLEKDVFGTGNEKGFLTDNWGELLKELRNSIVHRDQLVPSFESQTTLLEQITKDWHNSLETITCSRFCQDAQNDMFELVTKVAAIVYNVEWKPGPYTPGLWS